MAVRNVEKQIDGMSISVTSFLGIEGFKIKTKLIKLLGPSLGELAGGAAGAVNVLDVDLSSGFLAKAVNTLCDKLDESDSFNFVMRLLRSSGTRINGQEVNESVFNDVFAANYALLYKILYLIVEENYGNFFGEGGIGAALAKAGVQRNNARIPSSNA